jgi:hypothetical protein
VNSSLYLLALEGKLLGPLMARNTYKSNVTWTSYPFLPPTSASGFLVSLLTGERWYEGNHLLSRRLHELPEWEEVWAIGAYPSLGNFSQLHYRSHVGDEFNYEAVVWSVAQKGSTTAKGKKLAIVEEYFTESLRFIVVSLSQQRLKALCEQIAGRIGPVAKKGCLQMAFTPQLAIACLQLAPATGNEIPLGIVPVEEVGQMSLNAQTYFVPLTSRDTRQAGKSAGVSWRCAHCLWNVIPEGLRFRAGVPIYLFDDSLYGISASLVTRICGGC